MLCLVYAKKLFYKFLSINVLIIVSLFSTVTTTVATVTTSTDPVWCNDKHMKNCKLPGTKEKCPNLCKTIKKGSKNEGTIILCSSGEALMIPL